MNLFLQAAVEYHMLGLHPIPIEPKGKKPLVGWKDYQVVQPTLDELMAWWAVTPEANVGLVLGRGLMAVDIDGPEGEAALDAAGIVLPFDAPRSKTAHGQHIFLAGDSPDRVGLLPKVDIRGVGYVVAPPSVHESGHTYSWVIPMLQAPLPAPEALLHLIRSGSGATVGTRGPAQKLPDTPAGWMTVALDGVGEGQRDVTCTRLAGYFLSKGMPEDAVVKVLQGWAVRCDPPFPDEDVVKCVASIAKREGPPIAPPGLLSTLLPAVIEGIRKPAPMHATTLAGLDRQLDGGFESGQYILLGARPGVGKTALALQFARAAAHRGVGTLLVSREMGREAIIRRMLTQESVVKFESIKTGNLVEAEWTLLKMGAAQLSELPLWISNLVTVEQLREALAAFDPGEIGFVVVDYLQLLRGPLDIRDKRAAVEHVSQELRQLALEFRLPLLCLSSLARPPRDMPRWRPSMADLRESGELEHDADIILLLHREPGAEETELNVAKNRDGRVGMVRLLFQGEYLTFKGEHS